MNERRSIEVIKKDHPKKSPCSLAMIKNGRPKKLACSSTAIKNGRPRKLAHFQNQAMFPGTSKKTFKGQILRNRHKNTTILKEESS